MNNSNIAWHHATVTRERRNNSYGHSSIMVWFTGLSGAGKSTLAHAVEERLHKQNCCTVVLDGDNVRHGLCSDLNFSDNDREENIRRIGEVSNLFIESGIITLTAFIFPFRKDRDNVRSIIPHGDFLEIYVDCTIEVCERRDTKGLYKKALSGEIKNFTDIRSDYEIPVNPELVNTDKETLEESVDKIMRLLAERKIINTIESN